MTNMLNTIIVLILQHAAQTTRGQIDSQNRHARDDVPDIQPDPDEATKTTKYSSNDPKIKNTQSRLQAARDALRMAEKSSAALNTIKGHEDEVREANKHMKQTKHVRRQQFAATEATGQMEQISSGKNSM